ncbi:DUF4114 domain-containing protein [Roseomonas terrae]|uniref:DUF4114 domain-containing protein n=1 Tax=Neoroseomonas terrae TaxID=424799 RepID=A0ABS5EFC0_9PROT|nr:M10 family metallopeptidase [Neoroseomonas terrae]MBR0649708.1 DUF4114 domain-containing protein [Neoroseomonas terrae]
MAEIEPVYSEPKGGLYGGHFDSSGLDPNVRAVMMDERWTTSYGGSEAATVITYAFPTQASDYLNAPGGYPPADPDAEHPAYSFAPINEIQIEAVRAAFGLVSSYTNLTFVELDSSHAADAAFRFGQFDDSGSQSGFPPNEGEYSPQDSRLSGDTWLGGNGTPPSMAFFGTDHFNTIMHEMGHAFGLKHGHDPDYSGALSSDRNNNEFSVMTYASYFGADSEGATEAWAGSSPSSYMMYDIAALQAYYGANFGKVGTEAVYSWDTQTGQQYINGLPAEFTGASKGAKILTTVWTQGAIATYDLSNFAENQVADLRPGEWLRFSSTQIADLNDQAPTGTPEFQAQGNVYNALLYQGDERSLVSNLMTGAGNDRLIGNDIANRLSAGAGNDTIDGGLGDDTISGGAGADTVTFGAGRSLLRDTLEDLNGDVVLDLGSANAIQILGLRASRDDFTVTLGDGGVSFGLEGSVFDLRGDFSGGDFIAAARGFGKDGFTHLSFITYLPELTEQVTVAPSAINGIAAEVLLAGDGFTNFTVTLDSSGTICRNTIGTYRIGADGTISDVSILFGDAQQADAGTALALGRPEAGESIGFFLIQDGQNVYGELTDDLAFRWEGTSLVLSSSSRGDLSDADIFHSVANYNAGGTTQVLSGLHQDGDGFWIGFEDTAGEFSDYDFQDVVLRVHESMSILV